MDGKTANNQWLYYYTCDIIKLTCDIIKLTCDIIKLTCDIIKLTLRMQNQQQVSIIKTKITNKKSK